MKGRKDVSKTVKHCEVCQEDFGDRFSFCPVCGESLKTIGEPQVETAAATATVIHKTVNIHEPARIEPVIGATAPFNGDAAPKIAAPQVQREVPREETSRAAVRPAAAGDGLYHLTILQAPASYSRYFTMGAVLGLCIMVTGMVGIYIYDIFNYNLDVAAVESIDVLGNAIISDDVPIVEEEQPKPKDNKDAGGGGGSGKQETKPPSKGGDAAQTPDPPTFPPSSRMVQMEKPSLPIQATTQGPVPTKRDPGPYGIKSSVSTDPSDGPGRGGGIGTGNGLGQGSGIGNGIGSGIGSGRGNGRGNGIGNGTGDGIEGGPPPPAPVKREVVAVTEKLKIVSKPSPGYTDEARKNNISGTVRLRVTFSATGQVTGVSVISGLPNGLTEKAIAAARQINFTPEKRNGQAISISRPIDYTFRIY